MANENIASAVAFNVIIGGNEIPMDEVSEWTVEQDIGQPDMCQIALRNEGNLYSDSYQPGDEVTVNVGDEEDEVFAGEVVGVEPTYKANGDNVLNVRAFNRLHRLTRGAKSTTYTQCTDADIVSKLAGRSQLTPVCGDKADITHAHVYQNNQTDLEFLRSRAARLGFEVWVQGKELHFDALDASKDSGLILRYGDAETAMKKGAVFLMRFTPKMSSSGMLEQVEVRGWDPVAKKEIIAVSKAESSSALGGKTGVSVSSQWLGGLSDDSSHSKTFNVDQPIYSQDEAQRLADAKLKKANMNYMTGMGECRCTPGIKPGVVVTITVNPDKPGDRFNGRYMVMGTRHHYSDKVPGSSNGLLTTFRVARDAEGPRDPGKHKD